MQLGIVIDYDRFFFFVRRYQNVGPSESLTQLLLVVHLLSSTSECLIWRNNQNWSHFAAELLFSSHYIESN